MDEFRDEKGRWVAGVPNGGPRPGGGRPKGSDVAVVQAALASVLDQETLEAWTLSMRRKLRKGSISATTLIFDRVAGKPAVQVHVDAAGGALGAFIAAWQNVAGELAEGEQPDAALTEGEGDAEGGL